MKVYFTFLAMLAFLLIAQQRLTAQLSLTSVSTFTIDFQSTVAGINNGTYTGTGLASNPAVGQLDSDGIMVSGIGNTTGGSITTFVPPPSNALYAVTSGGDTWFGLTPGGSWSVILEIVNNTGASIFNLDIDIAASLYNGSNEDQTYTLEYAFDASGPWTQIGQSFDINSGGAVTPFWISLPIDIGIVCVGEVANGASVFLRLSGAGSSTDAIAFNSLSATPLTSASCTITNITSLTTANVEDVSLDLNWATDGSGTCSETFLIVGRQGVAPASDILVGNLQGLYDETDFSANTDWSARGNGNEVFFLTSNTLGADNVDYFVFEGSGTTASITGLSQNTAYNFLILAVDGTCSWTSGGSVNTTTLLPIELSSFTGKSFLDGILLEWTTATETNNDYMVLERSIDGSNFREIGRIKGSGTTITPRDYSFVDHTPVNGTNYYRLKQVDFDGTETYYHIIAVEFDRDLNAWQVSPTLARNEINVNSSKAFAEEDYFQIIDLNGKVLKIIPAQKDQLNQVIEVFDLSSGTYFLQLVRQEDKSVQRFIKR